MTQNRFSLSIKLTAILASLIFILNVFSVQLFSQLSLDRTQVAQGEVWRIITSNFVHFGWNHTLMNLAAFILCSMALFNKVSAYRYLFLIFWCCAAVGVGILELNPEYQIYAGLSGTIHGLIVAGLIINKRHIYWINGFFIILVFGKIFYEQQPGYHENGLQELLPVAVAYDAHLYGAIAGLIAGLGFLIFDYIKCSASAKN